MTAPSSEPWTIERICEALGSPVLAKEFLGEINRAPAYQLLSVFARWQGVAADIVAAVQRGRELAAAEAATGEMPGEWIDVTDRIQAEAEEGRQRGAA